MAWEEIASRAGVRRDLHRWSIASNKSGGIRIWVPVDSPVLSKGRARVFFGKGEDAGWMLIKADATGRVIGTDKNNKARFLQFSTLPFLPKGAKISERQLHVEAAGAADQIKVKLPWVGTDGRPVPQQVWQSAA